MRRAKAIAIAFALVLACTPAKKNEAMTYEDWIEAVASDIESLKADYPQLAEFSCREHCQKERLVISYSFRTHQPQGRPGWAGGVPNPDEDGIWFYIDLHDPDSTAQIHTQPAGPQMSYRDKRVMFLSLEGEKTKEVSGKLYEILQQRGAK